MKNELSSEISAYLDAGTVVYDVLKVSKLNLLQTFNDVFCLKLVKGICLKDFT